MLHPRVFLMDFVLLCWIVLSCEMICLLVLPLESGRSMGYCGIHSMKRSKMAAPLSRPYWPRMWRGFWPLWNQNMIIGDYVFQVHVCHWPANYNMLAVLRYLFSCIPCVWFKGKHYSTVTDLIHATNLCNINQPWNLTNTTGICLRKMRVLMPFALYPILDKTSSTSEHKYRKGLIYTKVGTARFWPHIDSLSIDLRLCE